jgi:peptidoglycan/LPS O-acetylase OafA/YrhL
VPLRRVFLLGAATIVSVAALIAVVTILNGSFGDTEGKIFATLATTFVAGSMLIAGLALLARRVSRPLGEVGVVFAALGFVLWSAQIWGGYHSNGYWKLIGVLTRPG